MEVLARSLAGTEVEIVVEIDSGHHRTGVAPKRAGQVAAAAHRHGLGVAGVFTFPGHSYEPGRREQAAADEARALQEADAALRQAGLGAGLRSGGSTPTAALVIQGALNEMRPGVYAFNDAQQVELGAADWDAVALTAAATVVSRHGRNIVLDAGSKVLGADRLAWATGGGRLPDHPHGSAPCRSTTRRSASPKTHRCPSLGRSFGSPPTMSVLRSTSPTYSSSPLVERSWSSGRSRPAAGTPRSLYVLAVGLLMLASSPTVQHTSQHVGPVGHDAVDAEAQQPSHGRFVVDRPDIDPKATVVSLAYESASDDRHDAFVFFGRLQRLERRVVKAVEMQHMKDPITQELHSGGGGGNLPWLALRKREIVP